MDLAGATLVAISAVAAFAFVIARSRVAPVARKLAGVITAGVTAMLDSSLDDDAKERAVRVAGLRLLAGSWQVAWRLALALAAVAAPILLADVAGAVPRDDSFGVLMRVDFIVAISLLAIVAAWIVSRRHKAEADRTVDSSAYGAGEKLIHALAFSGPGMLRVMARLDDCLFARTIADTPDAPPIFITSLARGGTTALLNALHGLPGIATHRYCDMPFISAPMLWSKLAGNRSSVKERERAHGDGMTIGLQSPEAFDEIFWRLHWPEKYSDRRIDLWRADDARTAAQAFFVRHFSKIARLRHPRAASAQGSGPTAGTRYLSKNNANIARLDLLPAMFPGCAIVIALRAPAAHAASLLRQHVNFTKLHAEDEFALRYVRDIGHLEFGALQRPIGFDDDLLAAYRPEDPDYWLAYWIACFEEVGRHAERVLIVTQNDLRASPQRTMLALMDRLQLTEGREHDFGPHFRRAPDPQPEDLFTPELLRRAQAIYSRLAERAVR
jgi:hypothetical protein